MGKGEGREAKKRCQYMGKRKEAGTSHVFNYTCGRSDMPLTMWQAIRELSIHFNY